MPPQAGDFSCGEGAGEPLVFWIGPQHGANTTGEVLDGGTERGACTITITSFGAVGELIEGTFVATVHGATIHEITDGVFRLRRTADR